MPIDVHTTKNDILEMFHRKPDRVHLLLQDVKLFRRPSPTTTFRDLGVQDVEHDRDPEQGREEERDGDAVVAVLLRVAGVIAGVSADAARGRTAETVELSISLLKKSFLLCQIVGKNIPVAVAKFSGIAIAASSLHVVDGRAVVVIVVIIS